MLQEQVIEQTIPPMSDFMESDIANINPVEDTDRRETRCLVFAGNVLPPFFKRTFQGMQMGGEHLGQNYKTLSPTKGLLRRCQLTPMVVGYDYLNADSLGDEKGKVKSRTVYNKETRQNEIFYYNECLPGDELAGIMRSQQGGNDKGIREVEALKAVDPSGYKTIQREIFPDWDNYLLPPTDKNRKEFFTTTAALATYLRQRKSEVGATTSSVIDVLLESNAQFERWAIAELSRLARLVKAPPTDGGKVYSFDDNPVAPDWFNMLGLNREEFLMSRKEEPQGETSTVSREEFEQQQAKMQSLIDLVTPIAQIAVAQTQGNSIVVDKDAKIVVGAGELKCAATKANSEPCKAFAANGTEFCVAHQPKDE